jgi:hypothetical protein
MNNIFDNDEEEVIPPSPEEAFEKAVDMPVKINLRGYYYAFQKLRDKNYTLREIAEWATETLGVEVNRNQVVYVLAADPDALADDEDQENEEAKLDAEDEEAMAATTSFVPSGVPPHLHTPAELPKKAKRKKDKAK